MSQPKRVRVIGNLYNGVVPDGAIYCGRATPTLSKSPYANPYPVKAYGRKECLRRYREWFAANPELAAAARRDLAGSDLACWCSLADECHVDFLLTVANPDAVADQDGPVAPSAGPCRYCGTPSYRSDEAGPVHICCRDWQVVITAGFPCPACQAARFLADPANRGKTMPALPRFLPDGRPFVPDRTTPPVIRPCSYPSPTGTCGTTPARLYLPGWRCPAHTPVVLAGNPEPAAASAVQSLPSAGHEQRAA